jgi:hypothetical protein
MGIQWGSASNLETVRTCVKGKVVLLFIFTENKLGNNDEQRRIRKLRVN